MLAALLGMLVLAFVLVPEVLAQDSPTVTATRTADGRIRVGSTDLSGRLQLLERSPDLRTWSEAARTLQGFDAFPIPGADATTGFLRVRSRAAEPTDDWKNQIRFPEDPFLSVPGDPSSGGFRWMKFTLRLDTPSLVYFQDSTRQPFHYGFIRQRLAGFEGLSPEAVDAVSLRNTGQRLVLGAVLLPEDAGFREIGIQIIGREAFPVDRVVEWLDQVRQALVLPEGWTVRYVPTIEQETLGPTDLLRFEAAGFPVASVSRWIRRDEVYSSGWAHGRIRFVPATEIQAAFVAGRLRPEDLLLTDAVPAEIPVVAGTITLSPATPNSHVALLSQSFGIPFAHVADPARQAELRSWEGQEVLMVAGSDAGGDAIRCVNVEGYLTEGQKAVLAKAKAPARLAVVPVERRGVIQVPAENLKPEDLRHVGGKAANYGTLVRSVPDHAPRPALAFTFDLWMDFLDQTRPGGRTLRGTIADRLQGHVFPPDMARLSADLAAIRQLIRDGADFSAAQKQAIVSALGTVHYGGNLRFRSSTNVEDSEQFSGAGLYDSYSGCLLDDTDGDVAGPSRCDPTETGERGVFRALRRVYASFYNDNAFLERLRHGVEESTVGMAVLVHRSFPDEIETANGVATFRVTAAGSREALAYSGELVLQPGAESVANPDPASRPEVISVSRTPGLAPKLSVVRRAGRVPLGATVLEWTRGYDSLVEVLESAVLAFAQARPGRDTLALDLEFKRVAPGSLVVKQIREIPSNPAGTRPPPFTLSESAAFEVFQHHGKDLFANHRLKSLWRFPSLVFAGEPGTAGFDVLVDLTHHDGTSIRRRSGRIGSFPGASIAASGATVTYRWNWPDGDLRGAYTIVATFPKPPDPRQPLSWIDALQVDLKAAYGTPQPTFDAQGVRKTVTSESTRLVPLSRIITGSLPRQRTVQKGRVSVATDYLLSFLKFGYPGIGIYDTKSWPLVEWRGTTLTGFTREPIRLTGPFSQTYDSIRHNFSESFLFEPGLDPAVSSGVLAELRSANIRRIRLEYGEFNGSEIWIEGWDETVRKGR